MLVVGTQQVGVREALSIWNACPSLVSMRLVRIIWINLLSAIIVGGWGQLYMDLRLGTMGLCGGKCTSIRP